MTLVILTRWWHHLSNYGSGSQASVSRGSPKENGYNAGLGFGRGSMNDCVGGSGESFKFNLSK